MQGRSHVRSAWLAAALCASASLAAHGASDASNPYSSIPVRNAFGIKPPPPPPPETPKPEPPKPPSNVALTGIAEFNDGRWVYLMLTKTGAKGPEYLSIREGESQSDIEVLQIDPAGESVRIRKDGIESSLTFKDNGVKPGGVPGAPGAPGQPGVPTPTFQPPVPSNPTPGVPSGPFLLGRGGVISDGSQNQTASSGAITAQPYTGQASYAPGATAGSTIRAAPISPRSSTPPGQAQPGLRIEATPGEVIAHPRTGAAVPVPPIPLPFLPTPNIPQ